ncbi:MAG: hypothetical protein QM723_08820 [Myxococcaceae bacterium]
MGKLRNMELKKAPSIAETIDWVQALALLNADTLDPKLLAQTLNLALKHEPDIEKAKGQAQQLLG